MKSQADITSPPTISTAGRWLAVALWITLIYTTIPFVRTLEKWFTERWDSSVIGYAVIAAMVLIAVTSLIKLRRLSFRPSKGAAAWLIAIAVVYVWWAITLRRAPVETIHLVEYAVLGALLYRALRLSIPDATVYLAAALIGVLVGTVDEVIQWITPRRYWDFGDIFLNGGSCALALLAVSMLEPPSPEPVSARSLQRLVRLSAPLLLLFTICLSMTPTRVQRLAEQFPTVGFLQSPDNEMAEYGYRHEIGGVGRIKSRMTVEELRAADATRGAEAGTIIDRYPRGKYGVFLEDYPPHRDPFLHEARVHAFSVEHHLGARVQYTEDSQEFRYQSTVALRQYQILDTFFTNTLRNSSFHWSPAQVEAFRGHEIADFRWDSWTSRHLITWTSESTLRKMLIGAIIALIMLDASLGLRFRRNPDEQGAEK